MKPLASTAILTMAILQSVLTASHAAQTQVEPTTMGQPLVNQPPSMRLDPIVITASRTPTKTSNLVAQTTVIDEADLQRHQGQTVLEVLASQSGFHIKHDGGLGSSSNFYLRGYDSKRVLILIDGIRYGSVSSGQPALNLLPAEQIKRIEILHGASGSSIYGSDAMGGVIQIFTKGQKPTDSRVSVTAGIGSHNHYLVGATGQYVDEKGASLGLSVSKNKTEGISAIKYQTGINADDDGYDSNNFSLNAELPITKQLSIGLTGLLADSSTDFDDANATIDNPAIIEQKNGAYSLYTDYDSGNFSLQAKAGQSFDELDNHLRDEFNTKQTQANLISNYQLPLGKMTVGTEWLKQKLDLIPANGTDHYEEDERSIKSGFFGYQYQGKGFDFQANARYDDNSQFDDKTIYGVGIGKKLTPSLRVGASYATGYRAPSLNDLYAQTSWYKPNPNLKVETSKNAEAFIEYSNDRQNTRLTWFDSQAKNMISQKYDKKHDISQFINIDKVAISGMTLSSNWQIDSLLFGADYTYTDAVSDSGVNKGHRLNNRPEHQGSVYLGYQADEFDIRLNAQRVGAVYTSITNTESIDAYTLLNLTGSYYITPNLTISSQINNLTNEDYSTNDSFGTRYNADGTNFFLSATYTY